MLAGFPKAVTKQKLYKGRYRLTRDDGYTVDVVRGVGGWWLGGTGRKIKSLEVAVLDMENGYTAHDQLAAAAPERAPGYYWVGSSDGSWQVAEWGGSAWFIVNGLRAFSTDEFTEIGDRVERKVA